MAKRQKKIFGGPLNSRAPSCMLVSVTHLWMTLVYLIKVWTGVSLSPQSGIFKSSLALQSEVKSLSYHYLLDKLTLFQLYFACSTHYLYILMARQHQSFLENNCFCKRLLDSFCVLLPLEHLEIKNDYSSASLE